MKFKPGDEVILKSFEEIIKIRLNILNKYFEFRMTLDAIKNDKDFNELLSRLKNKVLTVDHIQKKKIYKEDLTAYFITKKEDYVFFEDELLPVGFKYKKLKEAL